MTKRKKIQNIFAHFSVIVGVVMMLSVSTAIVLPPPTIHAASSAQSGACEAIGGDMTDGKCVAGGPSINKAVKIIINTLSVIVGVVSVIMLIYGGFKYVTSAGDSSATKSAQNTIVYALVGLIVALLAQVIAQFVLSKLT